MAIIPFSNRKIISRSILQKGRITRRYIGSVASGGGGGGGSAPTYYAKTESTDSATVSIVLGSALTNGCIVATSFAELSGANLTATFNSTSMTEAHTAQAATARTAQTFVLAVGNLAAGTYDVVFTGGAFSRAVIVTAYNNVNQSTPSGTGSSNAYNFNGVTGSITPASAVGDTVVCIACRAGSLPTSLGAGQTERATSSNVGGSEYVSFSDKAGEASTTTISATYATDGAFTVAGFALKSV